MPATPKIIRKYLRKGYIFYRGGKDITEEMIEKYGYKNSKWFCH